MWMMLLISLVVLLSTQSIVNILKIWYHIEMLKTSKQTAKILEEHICDCIGKEENNGI